MTSVADILDSAADLIEPPGKWIQNNYADGSGYCAAGAIGAVTQLREPYWDAKRALIRHLGGYAVGQWNDAPGRTQQDVVAALRAAADANREGQ